MRKTKIVLLGGSNSVIVNGLQKGLRQESIELINLALGGTDNLQNLFELVNEKTNKHFWKRILSLLRQTLTIRI